MTDHVLGDRRLRDLDAELEQLAVNLWRSPAGIGLRHPAYELPNFGGDCRSPVGLPPTLPGPVQPEPFSVPPDDRLGLHDGERVSPVLPDLGQEHPEESIAVLQAGPFGGALKDRNLLSEREILKGELAVGSQD